MKKIFVGIMLCASPLFYLFKQIQGMEFEGPPCAKRVRPYDDCKSAAIIDSIYPDSGSCDAKKDESQETCKKSTEQLLEMIA